MASAVVTIASDDSLDAKAELANGKGRRHTDASYVKNHLNSFPRYSIAGTPSDPPDQDSLSAPTPSSTQSERKTDASGSVGIKTPLVLSSEARVSDAMQQEDIWYKDEIRRLSDQFEAKGFTLGSQALYNAINKLLTCTEMKAALVLFLTLGSALGLWVPFIIQTITDVTDNKAEDEILKKKVS